MSTPAVVTFGETMALLTADGIGPLRRARTFRLSLAGAESNVAIALRRVGVDVAWCGRVGRDEFGSLILDTLRAEGVDLTSAGHSGDAPTGLMVKEQRSAGAWRVQYYRKGSAASRMGAGEIDAALIASARVLHVTGITPALSADAAGAVRRAIAIARDAGVAVSFDVNYRSKLWTSSEATPVLIELASLADVAFAARAEGEMLFGVADPAEIAKRLADLGPRESIVKLGRDGAVALIDGEEHAAPGLSVTEVDPVGAGDAFAAGYVAAWLDGRSPAQRLEFANRLGAYAVTVDGDCEGLPTPAELDEFTPGEVAR